MPRKTDRLRCILFAAALAVPLAGPTLVESALAGEHQINLRCNSVFPLASALSTAQIRWGEEVERLSNGRITTEDLSLALYRGGEAPEGLGGGLAACGSMNFYYSGVMPVANDAGSMPFIWTEEMYADMVNIPFIGEVLTEELATANIVPLIGTPAPQSFFMVRPLPNGAAPEDMSTTFEGMRVRTWGIYTDVVELLGGTPVAMPAGEVPVALRQGIIDGLVTSWDTWKSQAMQSDSPYAYHIPAVGGSLFGLNKTFWDGLAPADQELMREAAVNIAEEVATAALSFKIEVMEEADADPDLTVYELTDEEVDRWREALGPIIDEYTSRSEKHQQYFDTLMSHFRDGYTPSWER
jgi:TRAP-type C4-dicarboxylate transport system substrate-binding protein